MNQKFLAIACSLFLVSELSYALTLKEAIARAEQIDPQVQSALAVSDAARAGIQIARSKLLPLVQGTGSYGRTNQTSNQLDPQLGLYSQKYVNSTPNSQIYLRQALFRMADWAGLGISELQSEYSVIKLAGIYGDLWLRVSNAWFDLVAAQEILQIQTAAQKSMTQVALQAQKGYEAGISTKEAWLESKAQLAFTASNVIEARLNLAARQRSFEALTGIDLVTLEKSKLSFSKKYKVLPGDAKTFKEKVYELSPEILSAKIADSIRRMQ
jgi:outer membrane protein